jgi:hypothetical protein
LVNHSFQIKSTAKVTSPEETSLAKFIEDKIKAQSGKSEAIERGIKKR